MSSVNLHQTISEKSLTSKINLCLEGLKRIPSITCNPFIDCSADTRSRTEPPQDILYHVVCLSQNENH